MTYPVTSKVEEQVDHYDDWPWSLVTKRETFYRKQSRTPGYKALVANGLPLPIMPYEIWKRSESADPVACAISPGGALDFHINVLHGGDLNFDFSYVQEHSNALAVRKFFANAKEYESTIAVTIAEFPKTIQLIGNTASRLFYTVKALKRLDVRKAFESLGLKGHKRTYNRLSRRAKRIKVSQSAAVTKFAADSWLELQFGWKPLLSEIDNAVSDLAQRFEVEPSDLIIKGKGESKSTRGRDFLTPDLQILTEKSSKVSCITRYQVFASILSSEQRSLSGLGFGSAAFAEVAWEATPFSFVFDYFLPVGSWIQSLTVLDSIKFVRGLKSIRCKGEGSVEYSQYQGMHPGIVRGDCSYEQFKRIVLSDFPNANDMLMVPRAEDIFGVKRSLTALSLLRQIID